MHALNDMGYGMGFGWVVGPVLLGILIWGIVKIFNQKDEQDQFGGSVLDRLKERYVRGESNGEEFKAKNKDIT